MTWLKKGKGSHHQETLSRTDKVHFEVIGNCVEPTITDFLYGTQNIYWI